MNHSSVIPHDQALQYIHAGKALFTVVNEETGNRFTFLVKKSKNTNFGDRWWVYVLIGHNKYLYIGQIKNNQFGLTQGSKVSENAQSFQVFSYIFGKLITRTMPTKIVFYHHNRCGRCGDVLTDPDSILSGMGPVCSKILRGVTKARISKNNQLSLM